ncbi:YggT family protein [Tuanshanicoccus lijuaniae]|nr:YggT family protein [Aerococcaceae bacterium zg-1292]MBF6625833.1 YggT family protein [Aerococcaceae bacterium zg-BR9]MBF6978606.1 YggT family protein [Aerococcaceae bacterium zg-BR22]MBS4455591.1 YggT family protein [Aerococcaceae bacterium zg-A91]MBS4457210.1 YggT family protein [Aerococcaceae bacterium zg-BR33]
MNIAAAVIQLIRMYQLLLGVYALMTWFPQAQQTKIWDVIVRMVRPYLDIFDQIIPSLGGISFNVIIAYFVLDLVKMGVLFIARIF